MAIDTDTRILYSELDVAKFHSRILAREAWASVIAKRLHLLLNSLLPVRHQLICGLQAVSLASKPYQLPARVLHACNYRDQTESTWGAYS